MGVHRDKGGTWVWRRAAEGEGVGMDTKREVWVGCWMWGWKRWRGGDEAIQGFDWHGQESVLFMTLLKCKTVSQGFWKRPCWL